MPFGIRSTGAQLRHALRGVIKEGLFGDALTLPTLVCQLIHCHERAVVQLEVEVPADDHEISVHKDRTDAFRCKRLEACQEAVLVSEVHITPDSRLTLVLAHRRVLGIELFDGLDMSVGFHSCDESVDSVCVRHDKSSIWGEK